MSSTILIKNVLHNNKQMDILIEGNKFKKIEEKIDENEINPNQIIDGKNKAIFPAFYNTHTHISMTLLKGIAENLELMDWLKTEIWPREAKMNSNDIYIASKYAILELIKGGCVFINDMYPFVEGTMKAVNEMGIRASVSVVELDKNDSKIKEEKITETENFLKLKNPCEERIIKTISCHAVYTVSEDLFKYASKIAKENNMYMHIHACETEGEVKNCIKKHGVTPIELLEKYGCLTDKTMLAHCVHLSDKDIEIINKHGTKISHCPISNDKLNSGKMPLQKYLDKGVFVTLGTDGSSSNNSLSMIEEMKFASLSAKCSSKSPKAGRVDDIFKIATYNGAKAFGIDAGEIKEGKLADFILVDLNNYHMLPRHNILNNLVLSSDDSVIQDVYCDGKMLMRDRKIKDEEKIIEDFVKCAEKFKKI